MRVAHQIDDQLRVAKVKPPLGAETTHYRNFYETHKSPIGSQQNLQDGFLF